MSTLHPQGWWIPQQDLPASCHLHVPSPKMQQGGHSGVPLQMISRFLSHICLAASLAQFQAWRVQVKMGGQNTFKSMCICIPGMQQRSRVWKMGLNSLFILPFKQKLSSVTKEKGNPTHNQMLTLTLPEILCFISGIYLGANSQLLMPYTEEGNREEQW